MKKQFTILLLFIIAAISAQNNGFNYEALLTESENGSPLQSKPVIIKFTILDSVLDIMYEEKVSTTTDDNGIVNVIIGENDPVGGIDFSEIPWMEEQYSLKVEIDTGDGFVDFGTKEFKYVPYAKTADYAKKVKFENIEELPENLDFDSTDDVKSINDLEDAISSDKALYLGISGEDNNNLNLSAWYNTGVGIGALTAAQVGGSNTAVGYQSMINSASGEHNTAIGSKALYNSYNGVSNTAIGSGSLFSNLHHENTAIGSGSGSLNDGSNNIFIGFNAGMHETGSYKLYIESSEIENPLIYGEFDNDIVVMNANSLTINNVGNGAMLFIKSSGSNRPSTQYYLDDTYKTSTGYNIVHDAFYIYHANHNVFIKDGNILPDAHITSDLGADGTAWNNVYAHNYVTQGSAAYTDRKVTDELLNHPPVAKKDGDFDAKSNGLYELNPQSLPANLHTANGLKIDEIATYNYKANYEQQKQINELKKLVEKQQKIIDQLLKNQK